MLTIAHRLNTIMDSNRVVVLDQVVQHMITRINEMILLKKNDNLQFQHLTGESD